jgi:hypothetical protein
MVNEPGPYVISGFQHVQQYSLLFQTSILNVYSQIFSLWCSIYYCTAFLKVLFEKLSQKAKARAALSFKARAALSCGSGCGS